MAENEQLEHKIKIESKESGGQLNRCEEKSANEGYNLWFGAEEE